MRWDGSPNKPSIDPLLLVQDESPGHPAIHRFKSGLDHLLRGIVLRAQILERTLEDLLDPFFPPPFSAMR